VGDYVPGAPVDDEAKKRNQNLPGMGGVFNVVNLHLYHYAGNNPVKYVDPDGKWLDTFLDIAGVIYDIVDITVNPTNPWSWVSLAADIGCIFIPGATGAGKLIKGAEKASDVAQAARLAGKADDFVNAIKSGDRIFGTYSDMKKVTKGYNHAIETHHLVPQALSGLLGTKADDMASVVLDLGTHTEYSTAWNAVLDGIRASENKIEAIRDAAQEIYKDAPDLLKVTEKWLSNF
jgi:hypothetical protein